MIIDFESKETIYSREIKCPTKPPHALILIFRPNVYY